MHKLFIVFLASFFAFQSCNEVKETKVEYLENNRFDLTSTDFDFPEKDFNIIGFGAYHGSTKTEDVELSLLKSLTQGGTIKYYFPEVDYSTAYFFNQYLQLGDTLLLKDLVIYNGIHTPQERTIEVYEKWKMVKELNDQLPVKHKIEVLGIEWIRNYRYVSRHIIELIEDPDEELIPVNEIKNMVELDTTSYAPGDLSFAYKKMQALVVDYETDSELYSSKIKEIELFEFVIKNIKNSFEGQRQREKIIYENYLALDKIYDFENNPQFMRVGFFHIEKSREGKESKASFFTRLIENNIYPKEKVISVIGYFTDSKVVWDELYDDQGNYTGYTIEAGYGIGDYEKEYFRGIQNLKATKISDRTLFRLNRENSPYTTDEPDLIEVIMQDEESNGELVKGMSTLDFLDYAVLISDSKASVPIYELK